MTLIEMALNKMTCNKKTFSE